MGWASGSGPSQEGSSEAPVVPIKAEAWSPALRLGWALGPTDSKVSIAGCTAGPSPALPAQAAQLARAQPSLPSRGAAVQFSALQ